ncbi:MAG: type I-E CRISPR-associated protein Cas6/Cse3/CasE [Caldilinea sp. CFX5]|nr:type I-E CRISPR-associated protein Cas6/Cse3/CasE [Caldilinea sp. CFX5]
MYLSRLILNQRSRQVQRELANPYEMHRTLSRALPDQAVHLRRDQAGAAGLLYRVDVHPQSGQLALLVQSQARPDWSFLTSVGIDPERNHSYLLAADPWQAEENPAVKAVELHFVTGQQLHFRLRANPTKRLSAGTGHKGKRVGLYTLDEQITWLQRKAERGGCRLLQVQSSRDEKIKVEGAISRDEERHKVELFAVQFDGQMQITEPEQFRMMIHQGIGSGKAFGFGLLSVAPVR